MNNEKQKESSFDLKKAAAAAGAVIAGGVLVGQAVTNGNAQAEREADAVAQQAEAQAFHDSIEAAINAEYDRRAVVGEIHVEQGMTLIDEAERLISDAIGPDVYSENRAHLYDILLESSKQYVPNPGETFYVVETDIDGNAENGNEYVVTDGAGGFADAVAETIPSPEQSKN